MMGRSSSRRVPSEPSAPGAAVRTPGARGRWWLPMLLLACVGLVGFWEVMANRSRRPFRPFDVTAADFAGFRVPAGDWIAETLPLAPDPIEPNVLALLLRKRQATEREGAADPGAPVLVRLVHGYNTRDCMRIKGYEVELLGDAPPGLRGGAPDGRVQVWRMVSPSAVTSVWVTAMLSAGDLGGIDASVTAMPFPRVGVPDDPGWSPRGITLEGLRHPVSSLRAALRARWNASRRDLATFLRLRQPAWASDQYLTLVSSWRGPSLTPADRNPALDHVLQAHRHVHRHLREWFLSKRGYPLDASS